MSFSPFIICGSARLESNTEKAVRALLGPMLDAEIAHLCRLSIAPYTYEETYDEKDDFIKIIHQIKSRNPLVFATPIYWYTLSGYMKNFLDRITSLYKRQDELKHVFRGKTAVVVTASAHPQPPEFTIPLEKTFDYLGMTYGGSWNRVFPEAQHAVYNEEQRQKAQEQWDKILDFCLNH